MLVSVDEQMLLCLETLKQKNKTKKKDKTLKKLDICKGTLYVNLLSIANPISVSLKLNCVKSFPA